MFKIDIEGTTNTGQDQPLKEVSENNVPQEQVKDNEPAVNDQVNQEVSNNQDNNESVEDNVEEDITPEKQTISEKENNKYWLKLKKERTEKKELAEKLEQLVQEKLQMEQILHQAINTGSTYYKNNVAGELEMAQARLQLALENGNTALVAEATADISKATHALNEASKIANFPENGYSADHVHQTKAKEYEDRLYTWLDGNPEVDSDAPEYDKKLASSVLSFIRRLDRKYATNNKSHLIGSGSYYSMIDEYIDNLKSPDTSTTGTTAKHFGAVRSRNPMESIPNRKPRELTEREKKAALAFGQTDEQYLKYLAQYPKEMRLK